MKPTGDMHNIAPGKGGIDRDPRTLASHQFPGGDAAMLGRSLRVGVKWEKTGRRVEIDVRAEDVGHRVPTGFIDRHLLLVVEAFGRGDRPVALREGDVLPAGAGPRLAGKPGKLFAKQLLNAEGKGPTPFWLAPDRILDTRLMPGRPQRSNYEFEEIPVRVRVRLIYRRFWQEVAEQKGWPDDDITIVDRILP